MTQPISFIFLKNVNNVNDFVETKNFFIVEGGPNTIYVRLYRYDPETQTNILRLIPPTGSQLTVSLRGLNGVVEKTTTQPFSDDRSIFSFTLNSSETVFFNNIEMFLTVGHTTYPVIAAGKIQKIKNNTDTLFC